MDTDMWNKDLDPKTIEGARQMGCRIARPQDVANSVAFLASDKAEFITASVSRSGKGDVGEMEMLTLFFFRLVPRRGACMRRRSR